MTEFYHEFQGGWNKVRSACLVKITPVIDGNVIKHFICFENIGEGISVTNASEQIATEVVKKMNYDPKECRFFETYSEYNYDTFDEITYDWSSGKAEHPNWTPASDNFKSIFYK